MKVKAADIARKLNLSKATVSLALNGKTGVSPKTREAVLKCLNDMEKGSCIRDCEDGAPARKQMIKIIIVNKKKGIITDSELDLWTDVFKVFDRETKRLGYTLGITYTEMKEEEIERVIEDACQEEVAGIILDATEMEKDDFRPFCRISKPMVIYDNDLDVHYNCVAIDNAAAVGSLVDYLAAQGCQNIRYLANEVDIYNFSQRRAGFRMGLEKNGILADESLIVRAGTTIDDVSEKMERYLDKNDLPDAFIMENYQVSIGVMRALRKKGIQVPQDVSLAGVDELPSYMTGECRLTTVRVAHAQRAQAVMMFLEKEIREPVAAKFKIFSNSELIRGNSVKESGESVYE